MPPIFQAQRTATVAFAPNAPFLATGSFSGAVDASFSTDSSLQVIKRASAAPHRRECRTCRLAQCWSLDTRITTARTRWAACYTGPVWPARNHWAWKHVFVCNTQIYSVDFASSNGGQLQRVGGSVKVSESFERVTWGAIGLNPASYPVHPTSLPSHSELLTTCAAHRSVSSQLQCWYTCKQPAGCSQCGARCPISETLWILLSLCDCQSGLIAGGLADGTVGVWSADRILDTDEDAEDVPDALLTTLSGHTGPVSLRRCAAAY